MRAKKKSQFINFDFAKKIIDAVASLNQPVPSPVAIPKLSSFLLSAVAYDGKICNRIIPRESSMNFHPFELDWPLRQSFPIHYSMNVSFPDKSKSILRVFRNGSEDIRDCGSCDQIYTISRSDCLYTQAEIVVVSS
jgi:hypothetical protein